MRPLHPSFWYLLLLATCGEALIPDDVVTFMQILFASIPSIKKGTDSRVGFGFRFGPVADAQVVLEFGPQTRTQPLADPTAFQLDSKRHVPDPGWVHDDLLLTGKQSGLRHVEGNAIQSRALQAGDGNEWLSRWRTGVARARGSPWDGPGAVQVPDDQHSASRQRPIRIALSAPTPAPSFRPKTSSTSTPFPISTASHRQAKNFSRTTTTSTSQRTPTASSTPSSAQRPRRYGFLGALRQLWDAGAGASRSPRAGSGG